MSKMQKGQTSSTEYIVIAVLCAILIGLIIAGIRLYMPSDDVPGETEFTPTVNTTGIPGDTSGAEELTSKNDETQTGVVTYIEDISTEIYENTTVVADVTSDESSVVSSEFIENTTDEGDETDNTTSEISSQPVEISTRPEETSSPEHTTAKPVVTTKTPTVTTKSPVVTTKKPAVTTKSPSETTEPLVTYQLPTDLTEDGQTSPDVLIAPNGDLVSGHWYYDYPDKTFIVDIPELELYEEYKWWGWVDYYNTLIWGKYIRSSKLVVGFVADNPLPPYHDPNWSQDTAEYTITPGGTWW